MISSFRPDPLPVPGHLPPASSDLSRQDTVHSSHVFHRLTDLLARNFFPLSLGQWKCAQLGLIAGLSVQVLPQMPSHAVCLPYGSSHAAQPQPGLSHAPVWDGASVPHHLIYTIPSPRQPCSLLLRALLSIWQHLQLLPPLLAGQLCHPMCHYPASLFLLTLCLQQGHSLCCLCLAAARKMLLQGLPLAPCLWGRGEYEKGKGSGRGRGKGNRKGEKQGEEQEGGRERQKGEAGKGKRGGPSLQEGAEGSICSTSLLIVAPRGPKSAGVKGRDEPRSHSLFLASELWQQDVGVTLWVQPAL